MIILLPLLTAALTATAQEKFSPTITVTAPTRALAWTDCVGLALSKNPDLESALSAEAASRASYRQSFNPLLPSVTLSDGYSSGNLTGGRAAYLAEGTAAMSLFDMSKVAGIRSASAGLSQALANLRATSANTRYSLRAAYAQALFAQINTEVARQILQIRKVGAEMVSLRYESGDEYKGNMLTAKADQLTAEAVLRQAERSLRTSRRVLSQELGFDDFEELTATGTLNADMPPPPPDRMFDYVVQRPDVALQNAVLASAHASVASAQSSLWPTLTANYIRSRGDRVEFPSQIYGWSAGATLSYALFGGGPTSTWFAVESAKRSLDKAQTDLRSVENAAFVDLENSWASYANAYDNSIASKAELIAARQRNDEGDVRYASGLLTYDNWEVIVSERVNAEQSAIQSILNAVLAQAAWEKSLGKALGE